MEQGRQSWRKFYNKVVLQFVACTKPYRNECQEYFLGSKAGGAKGRQPYHFHKRTVLKSGSLSLLETSGPVQACNGIALLLPSVVYILGEITLDTHQKEGCH
jgi:hypothetical protein